MRYLLRAAKALLQALVVVALVVGLATVWVGLFAWAASQAYPGSVMP